MDRESDLHEAVQNGDVEKIRLLLEQGVSVNAWNAEGKTPLDLATQSGNSQICVILQEYRAVLGCVFFEINPLHSAARSGEENIVKLRLEIGDDVNAANHSGRTPLHLAVLQCNHQFIDPQAEGNSNAQYYPDLVQLKVCIAHARVTEILLSHGANVNAVNNYGGTPLHSVCWGYNTDIVRLLLENGADVSALDQNGNTPLHCLRPFSQFGDLVYTESNDYTIETPITQTVMLLIKNGANVDAANNYGETPLHRVVFGDLDYNTVQFLIVCGADVNAKDKRGYTPLYNVVTRPDLDKGFIRLLLDAGADMNATDEKGETVLIIAIKNRKSEVRESETYRDFVRHAVSLQAAGLYVSDKNIQAIVDFRDKLKVYDHYPSVKRELDQLQYYLNLFKLECGQEVERIKSNLTTNLSLKYILTTNNPRYLRNEASAQQLESIINNNDFPIYENLLKHKLETDKKKLLLLDEAMKAFGLLLARDKRTTQLVIPSELSEKILCYLSYYSLQNLILGAGLN